MNRCAKSKTKFLHTIKIGKSSFGVVEKFLSAFVRNLLEYETGCSSQSTICNKTQPSEKFEASLSRMNFCVKSGYLNTGLVTSTSLNKLNECKHLQFQQKCFWDYVTSYSGAENLANVWQTCDSMTQVPKNALHPLSKRAQAKWKPEIFSSDCRIHQILKQHDPRT